MITVYFKRSRPTTVFNWRQVFAHIPQAGIVEIGYDAAIGVYAIIEEN